MRDISRSPSELQLRGHRRAAVASGLQADYVDLPDRGNRNELSLIWCRDDRDGRRDVLVVQDRRDCLVVQIYDSSVTERVRHTPRTQELTDP